MAVATIGDQKGNKCSNTFDVGAIDYRTTVVRAPHKSRSSKNAEVR